MKTKYFTLGQTHVHSFNGYTLDKHCVIKITDINPRAKMMEWFGDKWSFEYDKKPNMIFFHRGIYNATKNEWENE